MHEPVRGVQFVVFEKLRALHYLQLHYLFHIARKKTPLFLGVRQYY